MSRPKAKKKSFLQKMAQTLGLSKQKVQILVVGLDNSGKTTLLNKLRPQNKSESKEVAPTIGFTVESFKKESLSFTCFDMSGQSKYRSLWEQYYGDVQGIIWVIDSTDKLRLCVVKDEIETMMRHKDVDGVKFPILFCANKSDIPNGLSVVDCVEGLELDKNVDKPWHMVSTNALTGGGLDSAIAWLSDEIDKIAAAKASK